MLGSLKSLIVFRLWVKGVPLYVTPAIYGDKAI